MELLNRDFDECAICLKQIPNDSYGSYYADIKTTSNSDKGNYEYEFLLKLLRIDNDVNGLTCKFFMNFNSLDSSNRSSTTTEFTEFDNCEPTSGKWKDEATMNHYESSRPSMYCQPCAERNDEILKLFQEISHLICKLQEFKLSVKNDFEGWFLQQNSDILQKQLQETLSSASSGAVSSMVKKHELRKYRLRRRMAKILHLESKTVARIEVPCSPAMCWNPTPSSETATEETKYTIMYTDHLNLNLTDPKLLTDKSQSELEYSFDGSHSPADFSREFKLYGIKDFSILVNRIEIPTICEQGSLKRKPEPRSRKSMPKLNDVEDDFNDLLNDDEIPPVSPVSAYCLTSDCSNDAPSVASYPSAESPSENYSETDEDEEYSVKVRRKPKIKRQKKIGKKEKEKQTEPSKRCQKGRKMKSIHSPLNFHCTKEGCTRRNGFKTQYELECHIKQAHEGVSHPFICTFPGCTEKYRENKYFQMHMESRHEGKFRHFCHYCGKGFVIAPNLRQHLITHTKEANFKCLEPDCSRVFLSHQGLAYHKRSAHTGERPFRCDRCGKGFFTLFKLKEHIKCIHDKGDRPFICHICGKDFPIQKYLYMHMRNSHGHGGGKKRVAQDQGSNKEEGEVYNEVNTSHTNASAVVANESLCDVVPSSISFPTPMPMPMPMPNPNPNFHGFHDPPSSTSVAFPINIPVPGLVSVLNPTISSVQPQTVLSTAASAMLANQVQHHNLGNDFSQLIMHPTSFLQ